MSYIQGFVTAVPVAGRDAYVAHARRATEMFTQYGAMRMVEAWGDALSAGKVNDFGTAVLRGADETTVFSWIEYPDAATCTAAFEQLMRDPRMAEMGEPPFDATRMIYGGFAPGLDTGDGGGAGYIDGFVIPVPIANRGAYFDLAAKACAVFLDHGATRVVEAWGEDVPHGKTTDFHRAVLAREDEAVVFSWVEWPDKAAHDTGMAQAMTDARMQSPHEDMPFDGTRMIHGGFVVVLDKGFATETPI